MAIIIEEKWGSPQDWKTDVRGSMKGEITHTYIISGVGSEDDAKQAFADFVPKSSKGWPLRDHTLTEQLTATKWEAEANYGNLDDNSESDQDKENKPSVYNFEVSGVQQRMLRSLRTLGSYARTGQTPSSHGGLINVTPDAVNGIDIEMPSGSFSETHTFRRSSVPDDYRRRLTYAYGKVNKYAFRGYQPGEVRFMGASDSFIANENFFEITYRFAVSENATNLYVDDIGPINKPGWAILWIQYEDSVNEEEKQLLKKIKSVYVEEVFESVDFAILRIGKL